MFHKEMNQNVYFCIDLFEIETLEERWANSIEIFLNKKVSNQFENLKCSECFKSNEESSSVVCKLILFDIGLYAKSIKIAKSEDKNPKGAIQGMSSTLNNQSFMLFTNSQANKNCLFYTQNDSDYFNLNQQLLTKSPMCKSTLEKSQYLRLNSILDALENVGYYGFITFRASVQRVGLVKANDVFVPSAITQKTQTQAFTQITQNSHYLK